MCITIEVNSTLMVIENKLILELIFGQIIWQNYKYISFVYIVVYYNLCEINKRVPYYCKNRVLYKRKFLNVFEKLYCSSLLKF